MKTNELKSELTRNELSFQNVADHLDVSLMTIQNKINGRTEFKPSEIVKLRDLLNLSEERVFEIFLNPGEE